MTQIEAAATSSSTSEEASRALSGVKAHVSALDRLAASRNRLRDAMMAIAHPPPRKPLLTGGVSHLGANLRTRVHDLPGLGLVVAGIESWWRQSPARAAGAVAAQVTQRVVAPVAREKPAATMIFAIGLGILVALLKPWRLLLRPTILFGVVSQIVMHTLKRTPVKAWLQALGGRVAPASETDPFFERSGDGISSRHLGPRWPDGI